MCGSDPFGTLYVGSGGSLKRRVGRLVMHHDYDRYRTRSYKPFPARLAEAFPLSRLAVCWTYLPNDTDRYAEESKLTAAYVDAFGEAPPLNALL